MNGDSRIGHHHHQKESRKISVRREPFLTIDHPFVPDQFRPAGELPRIGARLRLCHRVARRDLAGKQGFKVLALLLRGAEAGQDLHIAGVGRLTAENGRPETAAPEDLVHQAQLDLAVALSAQMRIEMAGPKRLFLDDLLERRHGRRRTAATWIEGVGRPTEQQIQRLDLDSDELVHPIQFLLEFLVRFEIPSHFVTLWLKQNFVAKAQRRLECSDMASDASLRQSPDDAIIEIHLLVDNKSIMVIRGMPVCLFGPACGKPIDSANRQDLKDKSDI